MSKAQQFLSQFGEKWGRKLSKRKMLRDAEAVAQTNAQRLHDLDARVSRLHQRVGRKRDQKDEGLVKEFKQEHQRKRVEKLHTQYPGARTHVRNYAFDVLTAYHHHHHTLTKHLEKHNGGDHEKASQHASAMLNHAHENPDDYAMEWEGPDHGVYRRALQYGDTGKGKRKKLKDYTP